MQTFLPYFSFKESTLFLDSRRLNKQIIEAYEILQIIAFNKDSKWKNHPAILMWKGYSDSLSKYVLECCLEWWSRGGKGYIKQYESLIQKNYLEIKDPYWFGDKLFHASHRSNLLLKDDYYLTYEWKEINEPYIPYVWPTWFSDFKNKIISKEGYKSLLKGLQRRNIKLSDCNQYWKFE